MRPAWVFVVVAACSAPATKPPPVKNTIGAHPPPGQLVEAVPVHRERVLFELDKAVLQPDALVVLDRVVRGMQADTSLTLQVSGHLDPTETDTTLGQVRATAVRDHLISRGIPDRRLLLRDAGSKEPRDYGGTEAGRAANRRVEFEEVTIRVDPLGGRVVITDTDVDILDPVTFEPGKVTLMRTSFPALDAVVSTLQGNPSILLVEVQSHVDERGDDAANLRLTQARAIVVKNYLVAKGVDPARLTTEGYGETQPIDRGHDPAAWAKNNRIAFLILKRR